MEARHAIRLRRPLLEAAHTEEFHMLDDRLHHLAEPVVIARPTPPKL